MPARPRPPSDPPTSSTSIASAKTTSHRSGHLPPRIVVGTVRIRSGVGVWYVAVVRCDAERIEIGEWTNIQDGCVLRADPGFPLVIDTGVSMDTRDPARLHDRRRPPRRHRCDGDERRPRGGQHPDRRHPRKGPAFPDNIGTRSTPRPNAPYPRRAVVSRT
ncbi:hexapeptide repeat-containing transferase [Rhodococcus wratislaviensis IFP 2016]|nr:hexapeptide repeat-containing transferase [Rhodococcus wratislaviensis IFP 2016]